jgi:hypothetical protein
MLTVVLTGNGESGFHSGGGALKTATTSKEGSRHANYPMIEAEVVTKNNDTGLN